MGAFAPPFVFQAGSLDTPRAAPVPFIRTRAPPIRGTRHPPAAADTVNTFRRPRRDGGCKPPLPAIEVFSSLAGLPRFVRGIFLPVAPAGRRPRPSSPRRRGSVPSLIPLAEHAGEHTLPVLTRPNTVEKSAAT